VARLNCVVRRINVSSSACAPALLGGTRFVGRSLVEAAVACGHEVTIFNRGRTNPNLFPEVEWIRGDRTQDLSPLAGRTWDAVVDVAAYFPQVVELSVEALRHSVGRYLFVSSVSVYADQSVPQFEGARVEELVDPEDSTPESYGARKAACERIVKQAFGPIDGRAAWADHRPARFDRPLFVLAPAHARGGRVLAPGHPGDPLQFIDVRDLAALILHLVEQNRPGSFNATGRIVTFVEVLAECQRVTGGDAWFS
jgi:2'-hydroxyisoflavone reductase